MYVRFLGVLAALSIAAASASADVDRVTVKVGYSPGGGYDGYGRLVAEHIGRFLPDEPTTFVENVPGAGSLRLAKLMMTTEPVDGSVIAIVGSAVATTSLLRPDKSAIDPSEIKWIGAMANQPSFCFVAPGSGIADTDDFLAKPLKVGATGRTSQTFVFASLVKNLFNPDLEIVLGFSGGSEINLAIERGELDGRCGNSLSSLLSSGRYDVVNLVGQWATSVPEVSKDVRDFLSMIDGDVDRKAAKLVTGTLRVDYPFLMPAGTPDDVLATYRAAFDEMVQDQQFLSDAKKRGLLIDPTGGADVEAFLQELVDVDDATIERARELID